MAYTDPHRGVTITVNLQNEVDYMVDQLARLIEQVEPLFYGPDNLTMKINKRWYGVQLADDTTGYTYGFIYFTVTNKTLFDKTKDVTKNNIDADWLEYSLHFKQNETQVLANNYVAASIFFSTKRGNLETHKVDFSLYGGTDAESAVLLKDFITKIKPQVAAFNANSATLAVQSELDLIPLITHNANGVNY